MTRLVLAQRAHLAGELSAAGIDCKTVVIADDENLEIAREHGCATVEHANEGLGAKFNAGYQHAAREGADWLVHIGSDDWLHPDALAPLLAPLEPRPIISGHQIAYVDLLRARIRRAELHGTHGAIPWLIPRHLLERCGFAPIRPERNRGMDGELVRGLRRANAAGQWVFHDPHDLARVDFKTRENLNDFQDMPGTTTRTPWDTLAERYPPHLVEIAKTTHLDLAS